LAMATLAVTPSGVRVPRLLHPAAVVAIGFAAVWLAGRAGGTALPAVGVTSAAVTLNLLAAVGEEAFFRRFLYDRTARWGPAAAVVGGAAYRIGGPQGGGGVEEFGGAQVAVEFVIRAGGVEGRLVRLLPYDVPAAEGAPAAIARLHRQGIGIVLGSYGSTISM